MDDMEGSILIGTMCGFAVGGVGAVLIADIMKKHLAHKKWEGKVDYEIRHIKKQVECLIDHKEGKHNG